MSASDAKKELNDLYLSGVPYGLRQQMKEAAKTEEPKPEKSAFQQFREMSTGAMMQAMPRPMLVSTVPGTETIPDEPPAFQAMCSPADTDGHTHMAFYDDAGNGYTSTDNGHSHDVRAFMVSPHVDMTGTVKHQHYGLVPRPAELRGQDGYGTGNPNE